VIEIIELLIILKELVVALPGLLLVSTKIKRVDFWRLFEILHLLHLSIIGLQRLWLLKCIRVAVSLICCSYLERVRILHIKAL